MSTPGFRYPLKEIPPGSLVQFDDGSEAVVFERNWGGGAAWRSNTPHEITSVRIQHGDSGGLADPNLVVTLLKLPKDRQSDIAFGAGQPVEVIGGKHKGRVGLVAKDSNIHSNVAIVSPDHIGGIVRVKGSLIRKINAFLIKT